MGLQVITQTVGQGEVGRGAPLVLEEECVVVGIKINCTAIIRETLGIGIGFIVEEVVPVRIRVGATAITEEPVVEGNKVQIHAGLEGVITHVVGEVVDDLNPVLVQEVRQELVLTPGTLVTVNPGFRQSRVVGRPRPLFVRILHDQFIEGVFRQHRVQGSDERIEAVLLETVVGTPGVGVGRGQVLAFLA